ncbi:MAG: ATP synthase F1 subunit delta [Bacteroidota bacterium]|nr:ATP synthase F1 subunit delta [Bacteroidota bacterium]
MDYNRIAVRYAKALLKAAKEDDKVNQIHNDLRIIRDVAEKKEFQQMLENPVYSGTQKKKIFKQIFEEKIDNLTLRFLNLLADKNREMLLLNAIRNYGALYRKENNISKVTFTTAYKAEAAFEKEVKEVIESKFDTTAELSSVTDEAILGGFIINIEDRQLDASAKATLNKIRKELIN